MSEILKSIGGGIVVAVLAAAGSAAYLQTIGPHGMVQPMPKCPTEGTCVLVAGLDHDVFWAPFTGGSGIADWSDGDTSRVVSWVRAAARSVDPDVQVLKYPRAIAMPDPGSPTEEKQRELAVAEIKKLGERFGAQLVVVGAVDEGGDRMRVALVEPRNAEGFDGDPPVFTINEEGRSPRLTEATVRAMRAIRRAKPPSPGNLKQPAVVSKPSPETTAPAKTTPTAVERPASAIVRPREAEPPAPVVQSPPPSRVPVSRPAPTYIPPPAPAPVAPTPARILRDGDTSRRMQRLYDNHGGDAAEGAITIRCFVTTWGDLEGCRAAAWPTGGERYAQALARFANEEMRGTPATVDGRAVAGGTADFTVRTAASDR